MLKFRESLVNAHHNYLVNRMLSPGFLLGDLNSKTDFWFLADVVPVGMNEPRIHGRIFDSQGRFILEMGFNNIIENPTGCMVERLAGGFQIRCVGGEPLLKVHTEVFANGYLTRIQGKLYDREGKIRVEPLLDGIQVFGEGTLALLAGRALIV